jgi:hypothetical protein
MEVLGRDAVAECYRIRAGGNVARLPDAVISTGMPLTGGLGHQTAYDWISRHAREIETAISALASGRSAKAPFDMMELEATPTRSGS